MSNLEILNLEKNSFSSVEAGALKNFPKLITLSLRHNQIDVLADDAFMGLSSLQKLDLSYNGIVAVSEGSLKHMGRLDSLDFTHNFLRWEHKILWIRAINNFILPLRALTADMIAPLPQLKEIRLDGNDMSIVEKNALNSAKNLKNISMRDNPLACDCKLQYFAEWVANSSQLVPKVKTQIKVFWREHLTKRSSFQDLMAFCKTPPYLEGAQLSQLPLDSLTCESSLDNENDHTMMQVNQMFGDFSDNFTMLNSSNNVSHYSTRTILSRFFNESFCRSNFSSTTSQRRTSWTSIGSFT